MPVSTQEKRAAFHKLHESGCFVLPNPWDVGSARALAHLGFKAIASTSAGYAWTIGRADTHVTVDDVCEHLTALCKAVDLPVNADFEGGFAREPEKVAVNVARGVATGVAGLSIEDSTGDKANPLYERAFAIERIKAARSAIDADNSGALLVGRCEAFLWGHHRSCLGDRPPQRLCGGGRGLPLCARHQIEGAYRGGGEGRASETVQPPDRLSRT